VRDDHDTGAATVDCVAPGTPLLVLSAAPYWREVRLQDGREGWAAKKYLEPSPTPAPASPPPTLPSDAFIEVHFIDVGHGDAIWISTHDDGLDGNDIFEGRNIVIDGGPNSSDRTNRTLAYLESRGHHGAEIDALIVTHPHDDHYPGADGIRRHFDVRRYYDPGFPKEGPEYNAFIDSMTSGSDGHAAETFLGLDAFGDLDYWGSELDAQIIYSWPGEGEDADLGSESTLENNASIVLKLEYGEHVFLFMGDAEGKDRDDDPADSARYVERRLLDEFPDDFLDATVLKLAHHGSETSSTTEFMEAVDPEIIVAMAGNRQFGGRVLPDESVFQRYCARNLETRILRTDQNDQAENLTGDAARDEDHIVIRSNGVALQVEVLEGGQPSVGGGCQ
jgi:beta-lactamase superfamily II metal-dependent hydrolase